jgi:hypothetical protein
MRNIAVAALVLPVMLAGCVYSHDRDRVATAPAVVTTPPTVIERRVVPETTTTITQAPAPLYTAPGTVTTTTRRDVVIENHY